MKKTIFSVIVTFLSFTSDVFAHDTTHIHPLITTKISDLIETSPNSIAYEELFKDLPNEEQDPLNSARQRLYWGTDFDPIELSGKTNTEKMLLLSEDRLSGYVTSDDVLIYNPILKNVITGVVFEDLPATKVLDHFYHAKDGSPLGLPLSKDSATRAMTFFNQAIEVMGGYTDESKEEAYFIFGQALHHVEDMIVPAHIRNDAENALFVPMLRYGQFKNTHVDNSTLRFLYYPRLALKQTAPFQSTKSRVMI